MSLTSKLAYNSAAQTIGKLASTVLGLVTIGLMTRYLGQSGFGQYTTVIAFASLFAIAADLGLTVVTSQLINRRDADPEATMGNLLGFRLVSALIIIGLAPLAVWLFPYPQIIKIGVVIVSWSYLFSALTQICVGWLQKSLRTDVAAMAEAASRVLLLLIVAWATRTDWGLEVILFAIVIASVFSFLLHYWFVARSVKLSWRFDRVYWRNISARSWPLVAVIILNLIYCKIDIFLLSLLRSPAEVGLYGAAYRVIDVLASLPFLFAGVILPLLVKYRSEGETAKWRHLAQQSFNVFLIAVAPLLVGGWLLARPVLIVVAGPDFAVSGDILKILLPAVGAIFFSCLFTYLLISHEAQKVMIKFYLVTALTSVPIYLALINRWSYWGAAVGTLYSEGLVMLGVAWAVRRHLRFSPSWRLLGRTLAATAAMAAAIIILRQTLAAETIVGLSLICLAAAATYIGLWWLWGIRRELNFD